MNLSSRSAILGIIVVAAISLVGGMFYVVHTAQLSGPVPVVPRPDAAMSTTTARRSLQQPSTDVVTPQASPATTTQQNDGTLLNEPDTPVPVSFDCTPDAPYIFKDKTHVFFGSAWADWFLPVGDSSTIKYADSDTFKVLALMPFCSGNRGWICTNLQFAKDNNRVYGDHGQILSSLDAPTFTVFNPPADSSFPNLIMKMYAKDKNGVYCDPYPFAAANGHDSSSTLLVEADPQSFTVLLFAEDLDPTSVAKDKSHIFVNCQAKEIPGVDLASFKKADSDETEDAGFNSYYFKDKNHVYYYTTPFWQGSTNFSQMASNFSVIEGADPATFDPSGDGSH
jgi:DKNYY family